MVSKTGKTQRAPVIFSGLIPRTSVRGYRPSRSEAEEKTSVIFNPIGERIDAIVEGNATSKTTVVFVHGFGTDKHETADYFDDVAAALGKTYRVVRFDFSGCGKSEGKFEESDYHKQAHDLDVVIAYVRKTFQGDVYIFAQSMGTFVTALLCPRDIKKTIFTGLPNANTDYLTQTLVDRFGSKPGGKIDFDGISLFPRSFGVIQKIGPAFWKTLRSFNPPVAVEKFSQSTRLLVIHPKQDDVVGTAYLDAYGEIPGIVIEWMDGNHNFTVPEQRKKLIDRALSFFQSA